MMDKFVVDSTVQWAKAYKVDGFRFDLMGHHMKENILRVRDALARCPDRLLIVPYERLTAEPRETMAKIHEVLGLPAFEYDPEHVRQITHEDDNYLGADLHTIRPRVEATDQPWRAILPHKLADRIAKEYDDLGRLAAGPVIDGAELA